VATVLQQGRAVEVARTGGLVAALRSQQTSPPVFYVAATPARAKAAFTALSLNLNAAVAAATTGQFTESATRAWKAVVTRKVAPQLELAAGKRGTVAARGQTAGLRLKRVAS
jgi:hypothetical protein